MHATDAAATAMPSLLIRRFVDSGSEIGRRGLGAALEDLEAEAEASAFDLLFVQHLSRFAADYEVALRFAVELSARGIQIVETCGGPVRPTPAEIRLFRGARP